MANHKTGAQRYNDRMGRVFHEAVSKRDEYAAKKKELGRKANLRKAIEGRKSFKEMGPDIEKGWNKGGHMNHSEQKSVRRHVDSYVKKGGRL